MVWLMECMDGANCCLPVCGTELRGGFLGGRLDWHVGSTRITLLRTVTRMAQAMQCHVAHICKCLFTAVALRILYSVSDSYW